MTGRMKDSVVIRRRKLKLYREVQRKGFELKNLASKLFKIKSSELSAKTGLRKIVHIRAIITKLIMDGEYSKMADIADIFNVHQSVIHHYKKVFENNIIYSDFKEKYKRLKLFNMTDHRPQETIPGKFRLKNDKLVLYLNEKIIDDSAEDLTDNELIEAVEYITTLKLLGEL